MSVAINTYEDPRAHAVRERYLGFFGGPELPPSVAALLSDVPERNEVDGFSSALMDLSRTCRREFDGVPVREVE